MQIETTQHSSLPYTMQLNHVNNYNIWPMKEWCYKHFGPRWGVVEDKTISRTGTWTVLWAGFRDDHRGHGYRWHFKNEADMLMFSLRWA